MRSLPIIALLLTTGCVAPVIAVPLGFAVGPAVDRGVNGTTGGQWNQTITTDAAIRRLQGDPAAVEQCNLYSAITATDFVYFPFADDQHVFEVIDADHCTKWVLHETGHLPALAALTDPAEIRKAYEQAKKDIIKRYPWKGAEHASRQR